MRYILEGEWSGYHSGQRHIVHRAVITEREYKEIKKQNLSSIEFTDGTRLYLNTRQCEPREKVKQLHAYDMLIDSCLFHKVSRVCDLPHTQKGSAA